MAAPASPQKPAAVRHPARSKRRPAKGEAREKSQAASLQKANRRRREIAALKADARGGRLGPKALLADPRASKVKILTLLSMVPRGTLRVVLEALLVCQINGARHCGDLTAAERRALSEALVQIGQGIAPSPAPAMSCRPEGVDRELDRALRRTRQAAPAVELVPSEFAAARSGLEPDPQLLRMVDRLVDAVRLYVDHDDGGLRARVVAEQWIRFRNYRGKVVSGEYPPPTLRGPAMLE
jgi:hypothetical protein